MDHTGRFRPIVTFFSSVGELQVAITTSISSNTQSLNHCSTRDRRVQTLCKSVQLQVDNIATLPNLALSCGIRGVIMEVGFRSTCFNLTVLTVSDLYRRSLISLASLPLVHGPCGVLNGPWIVCLLVLWVTAGHGVYYYFEFRLFSEEKIEAY